MSQHLDSDERGIILPCPACGTANRTAYAKVSQQGRCGTCKADLPLVASPVEMTSPAAFAALISQSPLPIVIAGGTSKPKGFKELFERSMKSKPFPVEISDIRVAADPVTATARGDLIAALYEK